MQQSSCIISHGGEHLFVDKFHITHSLHVHVLTRDEHLYSPDAGTALLQVVPGCRHWPAAMSICTSCGSCSCVSSAVVLQLSNVPDRDH